MSMLVSMLELATWTMAEVGKTRMWVQEVSCGVLSCDVCMFKVVLRPNTEPVDTESERTHREKGSAKRHNTNKNPFTILLSGTSD